jgi:cell shape-determining protein MreC
MDEETAAITAQKEIQRRLQNYLNKVLGEYKNLEAENRRLKSEVALLEEMLDGARLATA